MPAAVFHCAYGCYVSVCGDWTCLYVAAFRSLALIPCICAVWICWKWSQYHSQQPESSLFPVTYKLLFTDSTDSYRAPGPWVWLDHSEGVSSLEFHC